MTDPGWPYQDWRTLSANAQLVSAEATPVRPDGHSLKSSTTPGPKGGGGGRGAGGRGAGGGGEGRLSAKANAPGGDSHSTFASSAVTSTGTSCLLSSAPFTVAMPLYSLPALWTSRTSTTVRPLRSGSPSSFRCIAVFTSPATASAGADVGLCAAAVGAAVGAGAGMFGGGRVSTNAAEPMAIATVAASPTHTGQMRRDSFSTGGDSGNSWGSARIAPSHWAPSQ